MIASFYGLDESCSISLKEFCQNNSVKYSNSKKGNNAYGKFTILINDRVVISSSVKSVMVAIKATHNEVFIASDMFYYVEIF